MAGRKHSIPARPSFWVFLGQTRAITGTRARNRSAAPGLRAARRPASMRVRMEGQRVEPDCYSLLIFMAKFIIMLGWMLHSVAIMHVIYSVGSDLHESNLFWYWFERRCAGRAHAQEPPLGLRFCELRLDGSKHTWELDRWGNASLGWMTHRCVICLPLRVDCIMIYSSLYRIPSTADNTDINNIPGGWLRIPRTDTRALVPRRGSRRTPGGGSCFMVFSKQYVRRRERFFSPPSTSRFPVVFVLMFWGYFYYSDLLIPLILCLNCRIIWPLLSLLLSLPSMI